jgi:HemY protein
MRILFGSLLLLFVAASTALIAMRDPGYVLITREPYVLETSLAVFLPILALLFVGFYYGVRLVSRLWHSPRDLKRWRQARRTRRAREAFLAGLTQIMAGEWFKAEKSLLACMHAADSPFLAQLAAAVAAHGQNDRPKRERYLAQALAQAGPHGDAVRLVQARLQLASGELEPAHAVLVRLQADHPVHAETVRLLLTVLRRLRDWPALARLLPEARRHHWLPDAELAGLELDTHGALLGLELPDGAQAALERAWEAVPKHLHDQPAIVAAYARQLLRHGDVPECLRLLEAALEKRWDEELVHLYGMATGPQPLQQLETAEEWLTRHGESAMLYLTLGRLARRSRLDDRAQVYLEKSLGVNAGAEAHEELGSLFATRDQPTQALEHCRQALALCRNPSA